MTGAITCYEDEVDGARHTMMIARTAARSGALVALSTRVTGFLREQDLVVGVTARGLETGAELTIRAKQVINAAGVRMDEIQQLVGGRGEFRVRASKGVHLLVPRERINAGAGLIT